MSAKFVDAILDENVRRLLALSLAVAPCTAEVLDSDPVASALAAGDECRSAGDGSQCALNALQVQAESASTAVSALNETESLASDEAQDMYANLTAAGSSAVSDTSSWGASTCPTTTGGTCKIKSCDTSRGPAECWRSFGYKCYCPSGWCADGGRCWPGKGKCSKDTGGTCAALGCKSKRGDTECVNGKCMCKEGHCAHKGTCYPVSDTGGTCSFFSCAKSRGPTECVKGKCICSGNGLAIDGICHEPRHAPAMNF